PPRRQDPPGRRLLRRRPPARPRDGPAPPTAPERPPRPPPSLRRHPGSRSRDPRPATPGALVAARLPKAPAIADLPLLNEAPQAGLSPLWASHTAVCFFVTPQQRREEGPRRRI